MPHRIEPSRHTTAAEISRNFGYWQDQAINGPVVVTSHGRPRVVVLSVQEYQRLADTASGRGEEGAPQAVLALDSLLENMREGFVALDAQLRIVAVNSAVAAFLGQSEAELIGRDVEYLEGAGAAVLNDRYRWVLRSGERVIFETASHVHPERHLQVNAFPWRGGVGIIFTNLTEVKELRTERETWQALRVSIDASGMMMAELTPLGFLATVSAGFTELMGFNSAQLTQVRLNDLVAAADRRAVAEALNRLITRQSAVETLEAALLTRDQGRANLKLSLAAVFQDSGYARIVMTALPAAEGSTPIAAVS